jgi:hypothetical protein
LLLYYKGTKFKPIANSRLVIPWHTTFGGTDPDTSVSGELMSHERLRKANNVALAQSRGGTCFCTRGAIQDYDVVLFILALAKTMTPGGVPRRSGSSRLVFDRRLQPQSRADKAPTGFGVPVWRIGAQKPVEANCIYRPVGHSNLFQLLRLQTKSLDMSGIR